MTLIQQGPLIPVKVTTEGQRDQGETHSYRLRFDKDGDDVLLRPERIGQGYGALRAIRFERRDLIDMLHELT